MNDATGKSFGARFRKEIVKYGLISAYLYVCFSVVLLYQTAILAEHGISATQFGVAVLKALLIGKFILIGEAIPVVHGRHLSSLYSRVAWKSVALLIVLFLFTIIEEMIKGWVQGETAAASISEFFGRPLLQIIAPALLMLMILVPLVAFTELSRGVEEEDG